MSFDSSSSTSEDKKYIVIEIAEMIDQLASEHECSKVNISLEINEAFSSMIWQQSLTLSVSMGFVAKAQWIVLRSLWDSILQRPIVCLQE